MKSGPPSEEVESSLALEEDEEEVLLFLEVVAAFPVGGPSSRGAGFVWPSSKLKGLSDVKGNIDNSSNSHLFMARSTCPFVLALSNINVRRERN